MQTQFLRQPLADVEADAVVLIGFEEEGRPGAVAEANKLNNGWVDEV